jgi:hypothetical protein
VIIAHPRHLGGALGEVAHALGKDSPATVAGGIAHDPKSAESLGGEWGGKLDKSMLIRTAREIAAELVGRLPASTGPGPGQFPQAPIPQVQIPQAPIPQVQIPEAERPAAEPDDRDTSWPSSFAPAAGSADTAGGW